MKYYEKRFGEYYDTDYLGARCDVNLVSAEGMERNEYTSRMRDLFKKNEAEFFDTAVKYHWLCGKFRYNGKSRSLNKRNGIVMDIAYGLYFRWYVGYSGQIISASPIYRGIESYFKDFFPHLDDDDPFANKFEYPYKHMSFEHLLLVHKMDERLDLLAYGEGREMSYVQFTNYVLNHISCVNEEEGHVKYLFVVRYSGIGRLPIIIKNKYI